MSKIRRIQMEKKRDTFIDVLKAIGIVSIVMGHTAGWNIPFFNVDTGVFVYTYHIMIFMFVAGFTFKKTNGLNQELFFGKRFMSSLVLFNVYVTIFVLLHNFLFKFHLLDNSNLYSKKEILTRILNGITFNYSEQLLGAFWFLPMFLVVVLLFSYTMSLIIKKADYPFLYVFAACFFAVAGLVVTQKQIELAYHIQTAILAVPIVFLGYFTKNNWDKLKKFVTIWGGLIAALLILWILSLDIGRIELAKNQIINVYLFYPVTVLGMYFCLCLGDVINKSKAKNFVAYIGKNSFHIMGLHFLSFKVLDFFASKFYHETDLAVIGRFTNSGYDIKLLYVIVGVGLPLIIISLFNQFKLVLNRKLKRN